MPTQNTQPRVHQVLKSALESELAARAGFTSGPDLGFTSGPDLGFTSGPDLGFTSGPDL